MNKIIPFKKDLLFDTGINEIISISLEHSFHTEDNKVEGMFILSGEYKMNKESTNIDPFSKEVPFTVDIDENYKIDNIEIDIDDFYYEIINDNFLSINIDLLLKNLEEKVKEADFFEEVEENNRCIKEENEEEILTPEPDNKIVLSDEDINNEIKINNSVSNINYSTYKIYIVKEDETIENIMVKYDIDRESLEKYNNLNDIKIGDKLIIPITHA